MDVGLIGLPRSGKTTIFNLLTGAEATVNQFGGARAESHRGSAEVPDARLDQLAAMFHPKKLTPATLALVDVPGLAKADGSGPNRFLSDVRLVDALVHVVRGFRDESGEPPHPLQEIEDMELELGLADLDLLEKRRERLSGGKKIPKESQGELELVERLIAAVEAGQRLEQVELSDEERRLTSGYRFLTVKPMIWLINLDEAAFRAGDFPDRSAIVDLAKEKAVPVVTMAGAMEREIAELPDEDREIFMADLGIEETGLARLARTVYAHLGLISFLTAGEDEVRAWTIQKGTAAKAAAGKIHSDIERGFIRAEVVAFHDLAAAGSMARARELGQVRLEGKEYIMADGDVVNFRFNV